jgi:hypothetical protein
MQRFAATREKCRRIVEEGLDPDASMPGSDQGDMSADRAESVAWDGDFHAADMAGASEAAWRSTGIAQTQSALEFGEPLPPSLPSADFDSLSPALPVQAFNGADTHAAQMGTAVAHVHTTQSTTFTSTVITHSNTYTAASPPTSATTSATTMATVSTVGATGRLASASQTTQASSLALPSQPARSLPLSAAATTLRADRPLGRSPLVHGSSSIAVHSGPAELHSPQMVLNRVQEFLTVSASTHSQPKDTPRAPGSSSLVFDTGRSADALQAILKEAGGTTGSAASNQSGPAIPASVMSRIRPVVPPTPPRRPSPPIDLLNESEYIDLPPLRPAQHAAGALAAEILSGLSRGAEPNGPAHDEGMLDESVVMATARANAARFVDRYGASPSHTPLRPHAPLPPQALSPLPAASLALPTPLTTSADSRIHALQPATSLFFASQPGLPLSFSGPARGPASTIQGNDEALSHSPQYPLTSKAVSAKESKPVQPAVSAAARAQPATHASAVADFSRILPDARNAATPDVRNAATPDAASLAEIFSPARLAPATDTVATRTERTAVLPPPKMSGRTAGIQAPTDDASALFDTLAPPRTLSLYPSFAATQAPQPSVPVQSKPPAPPVQWLSDPGFAGATHAAGRPSSYDGLGFTSRSGLRAARPATTGTAHGERVDERFSQLQQQTAHPPRPAPLPTQVSTAQPLLAHPTVVHQAVRAAVPVHPDPSIEEEREAYLARYAATLRASIASMLPPGLSANAPSIVLPDASRQPPKPTTDAAVNTSVFEHPSRSVARQGPAGRHTEDLNPDVIVQQSVGQQHHTNAHSSTQTQTEAQVTLPHGLLSQQQPLAAPLSLAPPSYASFLPQPVSFAGSAHPDPVSQFAVPRTAPVFNAATQTQTPARPALSQPQRERQPPSAPVHHSLHASQTPLGFNSAMAAAQPREYNPQRYSTAAQTAPRSVSSHGQAPDSFVFASSNGFVSPPQQPSQPSVHVSSQNLDYGILPPSTRTARRLTLTNTCRTALNVLTRVSDPADAFSLLPGAPLSVLNGDSQVDEPSLCERDPDGTRDATLSLGPGQAVQLYVIFNSRDSPALQADDLAFSGTLHVLLNESARPEVLVSVTLSAVTGCARLQIPRALQVIELTATVGESVSKAIAVRNTGSLAAAFSPDIEPYSSEILFAPTRVTIPPGQTRELKVSFSPREVGQLSRQISMRLLPSGLSYQLSMQTVALAAARVSLLCTRNSLHFGRLAERTPREQVLRIQSNNDQPMLVALSVSGPDASAFTLPDGPSLTLSPRQEAAIRVLCHSNSPQWLTAGLNMTATVTLPSGSSSRARFVVTLSGYVGQSRIEVAPARVAGSSVCPIEVRNVGSIDAFVRCVCVDAGNRSLPTDKCTVNPSALVLGPGQQTTVKVTYTSHGGTMPTGTSPSLVAAVIVYSGDEVLRQALRTSLVPNTTSTTANTATAPVHERIGLRARFDSERALLPPSYTATAADVRALKDSLACARLGIQSRAVARGDAANMPRPDKHTQSSALPSMVAQRAVPELVQAHGASSFPESTSAMDQGASSRQTGSDCAAPGGPAVAIEPMQADLAGGQCVLTLANQSAQQVPFEFVYPAQALHVSPGAGMLPPRSSQPVTIRLRQPGRPLAPHMYLLLDGVEHEIPITQAAQVFSAPHSSAARVSPSLENHAFRGSHGPQPLARSGISAATRPGEWY